MYNELKSNLIMLDDKIVERATDIMEKSSIKSFDSLHLVKSSDIRRAGTEALIKALGPIGMAKYLEEYDNGGTGDFTKEKYDFPDYSIEDILKMK